MACDFSKIVPYQFASGQSRDSQVSGERSQGYYQRCVSTLVQCTQVPGTEYTADGDGKWDTLDRFVEVGCDIPVEKVFMCAKLRQTID